MASSVASERAFSSAGITISKRRNRLDGDIVEALQCLKSFKCHDLMLRAFPSVADEEVSLDSADLQPVNRVGTTTSEVVDEVWSFDAVIEDADNDDDDDVDEVIAVA
jgi:hAT family C-terminal dimerisation region